LSSCLCPVEWSGSFCPPSYQPHVQRHIVIKPTSETKYRKVNQKITTNNRNLKETSITCCLVAPTIASLNCGATEVIKKENSNLWNQVLEVCLWGEVVRPAFTKPTETEPREFFVAFTNSSFAAAQYVCLSSPALGLNQPPINLLAPEFYISILAHPVCKMWIIQEPKRVALWNKRHFEEKNWEYAACLKYSLLIFVGKNI